MPTMHIDGLARIIMRCKVERIVSDRLPDEFVLEVKNKDRNGNGHFVVRGQWIASIIHRYGDKKLYIVPFSGVCVN